MIDFKKQPKSKDEIQKALKKPSLKPGLEKYNFIMQTLKKVDVSTDALFQKKFKGFYRVRRNEDFCKLYFSILEIHKRKNTEPTFSELLDTFLDKFKKIEASYMSKLLATINDNFPVYDRNVLAILRISKPSYLLSTDDRKKKICEIYSMLIKWYSDFIPSDEGKKWLELFNQEFPNTHISSTKKIDSILWALYG